jgi:Flp pilus assembly protein TadB
MIGWVAVVLSACAAALTCPPWRRWRSSAQVAGPVPTADDLGWVHRGRLLWSTLAGIGAATFLTGVGGVVAGLLVAVMTWSWIERLEPTSHRRMRAAAERDLPGVVHLLATALESGCGVAEALRLVGDAWPGPATTLLEAVPGRLALGVPPAVAWRPVLDRPELAPLGRAMVRAHRSGAPVTAEVARLADELERRAAAQVEHRSRAVGVKAALPLGLCLLPSFLLTGVVPLVAGLLRSLAW